MKEYIFNFSILYSDDTLHVFHVYSILDPFEEYLCVRNIQFQLINGGPGALNNSFFYSYSIKCNEEEVLLLKLLYPNLSIKNIK